MKARALGFVFAAACALSSSCADDDRPVGGTDAGVPMDASVADAAAVDAPAPDADCATCEGCFTCSASACAAQLTACSAEPDCRAFTECVGGHDDPVLVASCRSMHPAGEAAFCAYWGCLTYTQCDAVCEDAVVCPRP